ncbi:unnamed protein product [Lactuca saligna]|uniref:Uncharacterized protein n=1 Tax=Lactuca saligna TaxID=75948 RepID=A0AA35YAW8_LACSI|nr:unnamed protein product [Lactuca saligna]
MIHLASPLVTSPPATSSLPHYKSTNDKLILITESFHSQLGVQLLHRTDDYECDSSTTHVIASRLTSLTATLIGLSIQLDFSFQLEIDFVPSPALHLFTKIALHLSTKIFTSKPLWWLWRNQNAGLNHCSREILKLLINTSQVVSKVNQTIFSIYLTLKNSALNFFVVSNLSRPDLKQELLALGEQIGNAGSGLSEDFISVSAQFVRWFAFQHDDTCSRRKSTRVESIAAAAGEGQDRGSKRCSSSDNINILVRRPSSSSSSSHEGGLCEVESTFRERETRENMMIMVGGGGFRRTSSLSDASVALIIIILLGSHPHQIQRVQQRDIIAKLVVVVVVGKRKEKRGGKSTQLCLGLRLPETVL